MGQKNKQILTNLGTVNSLNFVSTIFKKKQKQKNPQKSISNIILSGGWLNMLSLQFRKIQTRKKSYLIQLLNYS